MKSTIEALQHLYKEWHELEEKLGWDSIYHDEDDVFQAKLKLRNAAKEAYYALAYYRDVAKSYREAINAVNGDI